MNHQEKQLNEFIAAVVKCLPGEEVGATLTLAGDANGYTYVMCAASDGKQHRHELAVSATSNGRLKIHWAGFVRNLTDSKNAGSANPLVPPAVSAVAAEFAAQPHCGSVQGLASRIAQLRAAAGLS